MLYESRWIALLMLVTAGCATATRSDDLGPEDEGVDVEALSAPIPLTATGGTRRFRARTGGPTPHGGCFSGGFQSAQPLFTFTVARDMNGRFRVAPPASGPGIAGVLLLVQDVGQAFPFCVMGTSFDRDIALPGRFPTGTYKVWLADSTRAGRAVDLLFEPQP